MLASGALLCLVLHSAGKLETLANMLRERGGCFSQSMTKKDTCGALPLFSEYQLMHVQSDDMKLSSELSLFFII